jgi:hypothetical protein
VRWDKLFEGFASGIPTGVNISTAIEENKASKERTQRERDKLLDDLKTAAQNRELDLSQEERAKAEEARTQEMHPLEMEGRRQTTATNAAYAESAAASAERTRAQVAADAAAVQREEEQRKADARGRGIMADLQLGRQEAPPDRRRPTQPAPSVVPYADPEKYAGARTESLRRRTNEELNAALDPRAVLPLQQEREAVAEYMRDPNANPEVAERMLAQLMQDMEREFDLVSDAAINAVVDGNNEQVQQLVTKLGMLHPDKNMQMVGRLSEDGESIEIGIVQRGTDAEDFEGRRYPLSKLPQVLADYRNMLFQDMTLTESRADEAGKITGALEAGLDLRKKTAGTVIEERKASGRGGALTASEAQREVARYMDYMQGPGQEVLANAGIENPAQATNQIIELARAIDQEQGYEVGTGLDSIQAALQVYLQRNAPQAAIGQ